MRNRNITTRGALLTEVHHCTSRTIFTTVPEKIFSWRSGRQRLAQKVVDGDLHAVGGVEGEEAAVLVIVVAIAAGREALARFTAGQEIGH